MTRYCSSKIQH